MSDENKLSRREFIKDAAIGAAAVAGAGTLSTLGSTPAQAQAQCPIPGVPAKWDYETDVVVLGSGGAGVSAAYEAANAGAKVILLEKMANYYSSSTASCYGYISGAGTSFQKARGIKDSPELMYADLLKGNARVNPAVMKIFAEKSAETIEWLVSLGMTFHDWSLDWQGSGHSVPRSLFAKPNPRKWVEVVDTAAKAKGVQVLVNTRAVELIRDYGTNGVLGVKAEDQTTKKVLTFKARRAVVLCTGDMQSGKEIKAKYGPPEPFVDLPGSAGGSLGNGNTGDGLTMAHAIGADHLCMEHKTSLTGPAITSATSNISPEQGFVKGGAIWVGKEGKRFADEIGDQAVLRLAQLKQPEQVAFLLCDDVLAKKNLMVGASAAAGRTFEEWKALGAITQASTIEELAGKLGVNAAGLKATIDKYNGYVDAKADAEFKRADLGAGLKVAPFYGMVGKLYSTSTADGTLNIVPETFQVLDVFGKVIPRLYAAGDMGKAGMVSLGGTHICLAFTSGRIAGKNAAGEKPWGAV